VINKLRGVGKAKSFNFTRRATGAVRSAEAIAKSRSFHDLP
jgi:hypothetical protein